MSYSPSAQTAWESVYYIQYQMQGGWLLRGMHHFTAQAMVVLLALHLMQVVIDGAYRAPREVNFWLGLILMQIVLGLSLTGYLLPWDQKGYWATRVATNLMSLVPVVGEGLQQLVVGGPDYGHHTLTRFFALHAGVLPALLVAFLVLHVALFRRHGICHKEPAKRPETTFWPDQVLRDAVACLAVLAVVLLLTIHFNVLGLVRGTLSPDMPERNWGAGRSIDAVFRRPARVVLLVSVSVSEAVRRLGRNGRTPGGDCDSGRGDVGAVLDAAGGPLEMGPSLQYRVSCWRCCWALELLTGAAIWEDQRARWTDGRNSRKSPIRPQIGSRRTENRRPLRRRRDENRRLPASFGAVRSLSQIGRFIAAVQSRRATMRNEFFNWPPGRIAFHPRAQLLVRSDPLTQGPRLFAQYCASCHSYFDPAQIDAQEAKDQLAKASASNLFAFASRPWIAGLLNPKKIAGPEYFGLTTKFKELKAKDKSMEMVDYVQGDLHDWPKEEVEQVVAALAAQANLPAEAQQTPKKRH